MRYAIIANPQAGRYSAARKAALLASAASVLGADVYGLNTASARGLARTARHVAERCDVLVVAGGDGTLSDVINTVDTRKIPLAFLPMGTGNAAGRALGYRGGVRQMARRIRGGPIRSLDLIDCSGKRLAFMASVGFDAEAVRMWDRYRSAGVTGIWAYVLGGLRAYFHTYRPVNARLVADGRSFRFRKVQSLLVTKQPYYGFGLRVFPEAVWNDRRLHIRSVGSGFANVAAAVATAMTVGNRIGHALTARQATVSLDRPCWLQTDGDLAWKGEKFAFSVLAGRLKLKG